MSSLAIDPVRQYRRMQFVLGPDEDAAAPASWVVHKVAGGRRLTAHPDLKVVSADCDGVRLTLLGYMLDPEVPQAGDLEILSRLAAAVAARENLFWELAPLGGRYLLIVADGEVKVVGDANATMQLFHATSGGRTWCAAQPDLLADVLGFAEDPEAIEHIRQFKAISDEYSFPLSSSPYRHVRRLLPNHVLDLDSGAVRRYWPTEARPDRSVDEVKGAIASRLAGLMAAAANRFELAMGVSAGLDSRLMLAASRGLGERIVYYSGVDKSRGPDHPDVRIPRKMLSDLGLEHHQIMAKEEVAPEFAELYRASVPFAHESRMPGLQAQYEKYRLGRVAVIGNVSENARAGYLSMFPDVPHDAITARTLVERRGQAHLHFHLRHLERYVGELGDTHGYHWLDLLEWEYGSGNWFANNVTEFVSAWQDVFVPYNCRSLLVDMMSAPLASRMDPATELYAAVASELWPEVLAYPINPLTPKLWFKERVYRPLKAVKTRALELAGTLSASLSGRDAVVTPARAHEADRLGDRSGSAGL